MVKFTIERVTIKDIVTRCRDFGIACAKTHCHCIDSNDTILNHHLAQFGDTTVLPPTIDDLLDTNIDWEQYNPMMHCN